MNDPTKVPDGSAQATHVHQAPDHRPVFANSVQITVSNEEVTLLFVFVRPNSKNGTLVGEIVLTPPHAIRFNNALDETIKKHFTKHLPQ